MDIDIDMKHWHGWQHWHEHATWTWTCNMDMDMDMQYGFGYAAWTWTVHMHGCTDARMPMKSSVRHRKFSISLYCFVRHHHSGIMVSPVPLVTDQSVSAQLWVQHTVHNTILEQIGLCSLIQLLFFLMLSFFSLISNAFVTLLQSQIIFFELFE